MASEEKALDGSPAWSSLFNLEEAEHLPDQTWQGDELGAVLRHQMASPLQFDLHNLGSPAAADLKTLCAAEGLHIRSFADLFHHPRPPIELLKMTKRFAKVSYHHADAVIPRDVAALLYYVSILVALLRCDQRITDLDDRDLAHGVRWALGRPWLDDATRELLKEGMQKLAYHPNAAPDASANPSEKPESAGEAE